MESLSLGLFQKSWTASLETRGKSWAPHSWAAHPLGWQAQAPSSPWHLQWGSPSRCTQSTQLQALFLARTPCRTYLGAMRPPATGRHTHTFHRAWPLLGLHSRCSRSLMGTWSCGPSQAPPRTRLCLPTPHPATAPSCWPSLPQPGPCMTPCCQTETLALTWMPSTPRSPTLTSRVSWGWEGEVGQHWRSTPGTVAHPRQVSRLRPASCGQSTDAEKAGAEQAEGSRGKEECPCLPPCAPEMFPLTPSSNHSQSGQAGKGLMFSSIFGCERRRVLTFPEAVASSEFIF